MNILNLTPNLTFQAKELKDKFKKAKFLTISPLNDDSLENNTFIKCEIGSITYALALIVQSFSDDENIKELDTGFLSGESNVGEEEIDEILEFLQKANFIIVDEELINFHKDSLNLKALLEMISSKFNLEIINLNNEKLCFKNSKFSELKELDNFDGAIVFKHTKDDKFVGGKYFCMVAKIKNGDTVNIKSKTLNIVRKFELNENLKGTVAFLGVDKVDNYAYEVVKINRI